MQIKKQGHSAYQCENHLVLVSKYRRKIFIAGSMEYFSEITRAIRISLSETVFFRRNLDDDHHHLLLLIQPEKKVGDVVRAIKSMSGRLLNKKLTKFHPLLLKV